MATPAAPAQNIPGINAPLVNPQTGVPTPPWYRFLVVVYRGLGIPVTFPFSMIGMPARSQQAGLIITDPCTFSAAFANSYATALVPPAGVSTFLINKISSGVTTEVGTITFNMSGTGVFTSSGNQQQTFLAGDILQIVAPSAVDGMLASIFITLRGIRN